MILQNCQSSKIEIGKKSDILGWRQRFIKCNSLGRHAVFHFHLTIKSKSWQICSPLSWKIHLNHIEFKIPN